MGNKGVLFGGELLRLVDNGDGSHNLSVRGHYLQSFRANVGAGGSFDPTIVLAAGAPTPIWAVTDGAGVTAYSTAGITHVQSGAGVMSVTLGPPSILGYITQIAMNTDGLMGVFSQADLLRLPALTYLVAYTNPLLSCQFALSALPAAMTVLQVGNTPSVITGSLSDLKAAMTTLSLNGTASVVTGGATAITDTGLRTFDISSAARTQAQVDEIIARIYADRALFTYATPALSIGGTNAAPSGAYADEDPPVTGKGMIYELVVDPETEGFHKFTVTYTA